MTEPTETTDARPPEPAELPESTVHPGSPPTLRRAGRSAAILGVIVFLALLTYLTANYSRGSAPDTPAQADQGTSSVMSAPLSAASIEEYAREQLEKRLRASKPAPPPPRLDLPSAPSETPASSAYAPARAPRTPAPSRRPRLSAIHAPLVPAGAASADSPSAAPARAPAPMPELPSWQELLPAASAHLPSASTPSDRPRPAVAVPIQKRPPATTQTDFSAYRLVAADASAPDRLYAGTAVPLVLTHRVRTDIAGPVRAVVIRDVLDSPTHGRVLIPRGTQVIGLQATTTAAGDRRVLINWHELKLPDGTSYELPALPSGAADGSAGAPGDVNNHWWSRVGNAVALSLVGAGVQLSQPQTRTAVNGFAADEGQILAQSLGLELGRLSQEILQRGLERPPTITLRPGQRITLLLTRDLLFPR